MKLCLRSPSALLSIPLSVAALTAAAPAAADYANPPDGSVASDPYGHDEPHDRDRPHHHGDGDYYDDDPYLPTSTARVSTGPALRLSQHDPGAGLFAAVDVGRQAAGLRLSGSWVGAGSAPGLSQYTAELWLDLGHGTRLHPIVGAGAGVARLGVPDPTTDESDMITAGIGVLRLSLQYQLPIDGTDARAGIDALGSLPAVGPSRISELQPWALVVGTVGVGF